MEQKDIVIAVTLVTILTVFLYIVLRHRRVIIEYKRKEIFRNQLNEGWKDLHDRITESINEEPIMEIEEVNNEVSETCTVD